MANCYICGRPGASIRREVQTGTSTSYYTSGGGRTGTSDRTYYGLRVICEDCDSALTRRHRKVVAISIAWGIAILSFVIWCAATMTP